MYKSLCNIHFHASLCRYEVIKHIYVPDSKFEFPSHEDYGKLRRFANKWLQDHSPWLIYSKMLDGGFCLPCVLFTKSQGNVEVGALVTKPLHTFNKATELFRKHSTLNYHSNAMANMHQFMSRMEHSQPTVIELANTNYARVVQENR
jgi:hypothetical protein